MKKLINFILKLFSKVEEEKTETETVTQIYKDMVISNNGLNLIKHYEGLRLKAYKCPANVMTIGYGHTKGVKETDEITEGVAENYLREDLKPIENYLNAELILTQNQFDALCSFCFNVGLGAFQKSTLLKKIKANAAKHEIYEEITKWRYIGKQVSQGLLNRRIAEGNLYIE